MKYTLLELVQEVLSAMDSDEVNSITDTTESLQVARIVRQVYYDLIDDLNPPEHYTAFELNASGDSTKPTLMTVPSDISKVKWVKYDCMLSTETVPNYRDVEYMDKKKFMDMTYLLQTDLSNVGSFNITTVDSSTIPVYYYNDRAPLYYTTWDDNTILFDAYDKAVDDTLQKNKTSCYGRKIITFSLTDNYTPDLNETNFARLLNEAKKLAFAELKSVSHVIADQNARRSRSRSYKEKNKIVGLSDFDRLPSFGRK